MSKVRVRIAPSPTGHLHIGNLRTALFNYLFARSSDGAFLLRVEDTDRARSREEYTEEIASTLQWAGLEVDEQPLIQSTRLETHKKAIQQLLDEQKAYRCFCDQDRSGDEYYSYDGRCRRREPQPDDEGNPFVVRIKVPLEQDTITFDDLIKGRITIGIDQIDDFVIARSDGTPVYNFVVVLDDVYMGITHVIRGEDHISNTPKQIILYEALGLPIPSFGHVPLILGPSGAPLSKRDADTAVRDYKKKGYLPDALCNYLVRLGWSHGDQELFSRQELISYFSLKQVGKSGATFDQEKLDWVNGTYIRQSDDAVLREIILSDVDANFEKKCSSWDAAIQLKAIAAYKDRVQNLQSMVDELVILHAGPAQISKQELDTWIAPETKQLLVAAKEALQSIEDFSFEAIKKTIKELCKKHSVKMPQIAQPIRLALVGKTSSPGVVQLLEIVGKNVACERIQTLIDTLP